MSVSRDPNPQDSPSSPAPEAPTPRPNPRAAHPRRWLSALRTLGIVALALILIGAIGVGGAEYYTGTPDFCGSCHIMDPYYKSWGHDLHGKKLGVRCVDCHYAPGERFTFKAKFKGLSQAASYFSGRAGASRPRAHVSDAGCLTAACHGDGDYLAQVLPIGESRTEKRFVQGHEIEIARGPTVHFRHDKHLQVGDRAAETEREREEVAQRLRAALPADAFTQVQNAAVSVVPSDERQKAMTALLSQLNRADLTSVALELLRLEHLKTRLQQLDRLSCSACHSYDASGAHHLRVEWQTCYTCHFMNESFNRGTAECLKCHEPPVREIFVHAESPVAGSTPVLMNHQDIVDRNIDCASCHLDVVQGESRVTARECTACHDQQRYLADFEQRTTETIAEYHRVHVAAQRARCADCHQGVRHELIDPTQIATSAGFLTPVQNDCRHCHPNHHAQQVELLMGTGGAGLARAMPNAMFGSRVNCRACHTQSGSDFKGAPLIQATEQTCVDCHGSDYQRLFDQWRTEIANYLKEADEALARVDARVAEVQAGGGAVPDQVNTLVALARTNVHLIQAANGIHNKPYALQLLDASIRSLDEAMTLLLPR